MSFATTHFHRILVLGSLLFPLLLHAQPYWVKDVGGLGNDNTADVKVDTDGSIYITGEFSGTINFGGSNYASSGSIDMFVARMTPTGDVTWFKHGGGSGIDRGLKLDVRGDVLALAGEFMGTANMFGTTLTSAGGTADMFVAALNKSDGSLQWIRQGGGGAGTDSPGGVSIASNGRISVAGQFRGEAVWGSQQLTSMIDPGTGTYGTDIFVASYSPAGDLLWLKQGAAKFADKGVDLVHGTGSEVFVAGQFSDTITFDQQHNNVLMNASFLIRLDADGNEVWFRRFGGAGFNHVNDLELTPDNKLAIVGDVQGTMVWSGNTPVSITSVLPYAYYLLLVDLNGTLLDDTVVNSENGVHGKALTAAANTLAVLGEFNCDFTALQDHYGATGIFMAVGNEDLFIARHQPSNLALLEAQQFGGRSEKSAGGIDVLPAGNLIFTGSFQMNLIFPGVFGFTADLTTYGGNLQGNATPNYCGDSDYGIYAGSTSAGLTDGFVARGHVQGREPYDWWRRTGTGCDREPLEPCIRRPGETTCADTLRSCGSVNLNVLLRFSHIAGASTNYLGPPVTYQWSNNSTNTSISVASTGDHWVTVTSANGCWQWTDTIHVIIDPLPPAPLISDDVVVNTNASTPGPISLCDPQTQWVWVTNMDGSDEYHWTTPLGETLPLYADSVQVDTTGSYMLTVVNEYGCERTVSVPVNDAPSPELPELDVDISFFFPEDTDLNDTISVCAGTGVDFIYMPTWYVDGVEAELPDGLQVFWGLAPGPPTTLGDEGPQQGPIPLNGSAWYPVDLQVMVSNEPCGEDSIIFYAIDSIYVEVYPAMNTSVELIGPGTICDGDSVILVASCTECDGMGWTGPNFIQLSEDSILVGNSGLFTVTAFAQDQHGCSYESQAGQNVTIAMGPVLSVSPNNGIICPNATATISTTATGTGHIWYGPEGPILGEGSSLTTDVPGTYYLAMMIGECEVTSNNVTLTQYGTPFLDLGPVQALCHPDDEVQIQAVTVAGAVIQWQAPLSGSAPLQTVTEPGTYSCSVTACGITTPLTVEVPYAPAEVEVTTPGPFNICPGGSVELHGTGNGTFTWLPAGTGGPTLTVSSAGSYTLQVQNPEGCVATSPPVVVNAISFPDPLLVGDTTICSGTLLTIQGSGSGSITWYADQDLSTLLGTGTSYTALFNTSTVLYVQQEEAGCVGGSQEVLVDVTPRPAPVQISGPDSLCLGDPFEIMALAPDTIDLLWGSPAGTITGMGTYVEVSTVEHTGLYSVTPSYHGCDGTGSTHWLQVNVPQDLQQPEEVWLCLGGAVTLTVPGNFTDVIWSNGSTTYSYYTTTAAQVDVSASDQYGCPAYAAIDIWAEECEVEVPNVFTPNGDGVNDAWSPSGGFVNAHAWIRNRWGNMVYEGDMTHRPWNGINSFSGEQCVDGVYYYVLSLIRADGSIGKHEGYIHLLDQQ